MGDYDDCLKSGKTSAVCLAESLLRNGKPTMGQYDKYAKSEGGKRRRKSRRQNKSKRSRKSRRRRY